MISFSSQRIPRHPDDSSAHPSKTRSGSACQFTHDRQSLPPSAGKRLRGTSMTIAKTPRDPVHSLGPLVPLVLIQMIIHRHQPRNRGKTVPGSIKSSCGTYATRSCRRAISSPSSGLLQPRKDSQQRRFPRPIRPDQSRCAPLGDSQRNPREEQPRPKPFRKISSGQQHSAWQLSSKSEALKSHSAALPPARPATSLVES